MTALNKSQFVNANGEFVEYDGSPITWRVSVYGIVIKAGQIVLSKSRKEKTFDVPGGGVEIGEMPDEALRREGLEEIGVPLKMGKLIHHFFDRFYHAKQAKFYQTVQLFYEAELQGDLGQPSDPEMEPPKWVPIARISEIPLPNEVRQAILQAMAATAQTKRSTFPIAAHVIFMKGKQVLMTRRFKTGYEDGNYSLPAGHVEVGETPKEGACREAQEEVGIKLEPSQLEPVLVMSRMGHRQSTDFFFVCRNWTGEPCNTEPHKCDDVAWFPLDKLPVNTVPYIQKALELVRKKQWYTEVKL